MLHASNSTPQRFYVTDFDNTYFYGTDSYATDAYVADVFVADLYVTEFNVTLHNVTLQDFTLQHCMVHVYSFKQLLKNTMGVNVCVCVHVCA